MRCNIMSSPLEGTHRSADKDVNALFFDGDGVIQTRRVVDRSGYCIVSDV